MLQAMADASDVLTPEQRTKVAERLKQRMDRRWRCADAAPRRAANSLPCARCSNS